MEKTEEKNQKTIKAQDEIQKREIPEAMDSAVWITHGSPEDWEKVAAAEQACFPPAEAASAKHIRERLERYPSHFWLLYENGKLVSFVNGMVTNEPNLTDEMYENVGMHQEKGRWQMIFGVGTLPSFRRKGCAGRLLEAAIADARLQGRAGLVLTCKERLLHYYEKFGFVNEGISCSVHGNAVWYQMRLTF